MRLALAVPLLLIAPAAAQAAWTGQDLSAPHTFVDDPALIVSRERARARLRGASRTGSATAAAAARGRHARARRGRLRPPCGSCARRASAGRATIVAGLAPLGADGALLRCCLAGRGDAAHGRLAVRFGSTSGRFGRLRTIRRARAVPIAGASLAANARGDAALAWFEDRGTRPTASTWRCAAPATASASRGGSPRAASAAWRRRSASAATRSWPGTPAASLRTRFKPRGRARLPRRRTRSAPSPPTSPTCTRSSRRPGARCWRGAPSSPPRAATAAPSASRPRPARPERGASTARGCSRRSRPRPPTGSAARSTPSSTPPAWWRSPGAAPPACAPRAARRPRRRCRRAGTTAVLSDLAAGPDGRLLAVWDGGVDDPRASCAPPIAAASARRSARRRTSRRRARRRASATAASSATGPSWCSPRAAPAAAPVAQAYVR